MKSSFAIILKPLDEYISSTHFILSKRGELLNFIKMDEAYNSRRGHKACLKQFTKTDGFKHISVGSVSTLVCACG